MIFHTDMSDDDNILRWTQRLVTAESLEQRLNGHRVIEIPSDAVVTPLALDIVKERSLSLTRTDVDAHQSNRGSWGYASDRHYPLLASAVATITRRGVVLEKFPENSEHQLGQWAKEAAAWISAGQCRGGFLFTVDPGLICCVANKVSGVRAIGISTFLQAAKATLTVGANLLVVEMPGRTFFELRQILQMAADISEPACPQDIAKILGELDGHAHC